MLAGKTNYALTWNTGCVPPNILALVVLKSFHLSNCWRSTKLIITQSKVKLCNDMASKYTTFTGCYSWLWSVKLPCQNTSPEGTFYPKVISWFVPITCCNISGQTQFVLNCCCNISGQIQFGLICCCNISGQTEKMKDGPGKTIFFERSYMFCSPFNWSWSSSCI